MSVGPNFEVLIVEREVWIVVGIAASPVPPSKCGDLIGVVAEAAALAFLMDQSCIRTDHATIAPINKPIAVVDVTISDCKLIFVEPPLLKKQRAGRQQTGRCHARPLAGGPQERKVSPLIRIHILEGMSGHAVMKVVDDAGVLDRPVPVDQLRTDSAHAGHAAVGDQAGRAPVARRPLCQGRRYGVVCVESGGRRPCPGTH